MIDEYNFDGGDTVRIIDNEAIVEERDGRKFKIVGFKDFNDCKSFVLWGDFEEYEKNPYFLYNNQPSEIEWKYL